MKISILNIDTECENDRGETVIGGNAFLKV